MNYLQDQKFIDVNGNKEQLLKFVLGLNLIAIIFTFILNFLGVPFLKFQYLFHVTLTLFAILMFDFLQILPILLTLFFLEGQGRIVWEYSNWSRIIFDILIAFSIFKVFIKKKKIVNLKRIPYPLLILITLHFLWYLLEFFNLYSLSSFIVLAASKIYIFPILLFLGLTQIDFEIENSAFQKMLFVFIIIFILELVLTFYQFKMKESFVLQISPYYQKAMKENIFSDKFYRPFGTTNLPGSPSIFFYLTIGLLFLRNVSKTSYLFRSIIIGVTGYAIILCQIRSAFIKFALIVILFHIGELFFNRFRIKHLATILLLTFGIVFGTQLFTETKDYSSGDAGLDYARDRFATLSDFNKASSSRLNWDNFVKMATNKLSNFPLGFGPGLTGAIGNLSIEELNKNKFINRDMIWHGDNLFISLFIDFGFGAIFYILILFYIPIYFLRYLFLFYQNKYKINYNVLLISFSSIVVIILGNWGAISINYNPESFMFWFFAALGFSTIAKFKNSLIENEQEN